MNKVISHQRCCEGGPRQDQRWLQWSQSSSYGSQRQQLLPLALSGRHHCWLFSAANTSGKKCFISSSTTGVGDHHILPCWGDGQRTACWRIWRFSWLWRWWKKKTRSSSAWTAPGILAWAAPPWWRPFSSWLHVRKLQETKNSSRKTFKWGQNTNSRLFANSKDRNHEVSFKRQHSVTKPSWSL